MVAAAQHDRASLVHRDTKGGRRLWYRLNVIQQPERARACGSGPKSSADRRPVDPPPVVELRIFEGATFQHSKDITFNYNANFFLYPTLDHARIMAHGRVQTPAANAPPVLTGVPVSGMAYLDRPQEAGYFLFPDLSVRHEGRYRLTFNLYEETKEDKDMDLEPTDSGPLPNFPAPPSFDWRMSVKSQDFVVYSAKKFPGLTESTALSRTVAEQGCRVRIRRDVRMRRRDGKGGSGGDYDNVDEGYRRRRTPTPEVERMNRARSASNHSVERTPYSVDPQRRQSGVGLDYPPPPPSFGGQQTYSGGGHLSFGNQTAIQYPAQPLPHHSNQPSSVPASPSYQGGPYPAPATYAAPPPSLDRPPSQHYQAPDPSPRRESYVEYRRPSSSMSNYHPPSTPEADYKFTARHVLPPQTTAAPPTNSKSDVSLSLPPMRVLEDAIPPGSAADMDQHRGSIVARDDAIVPQPQPQPAVGSKRKPEHAFGELAPERIQGGQRPVNNYTDEYDNRFRYKRADGTFADKQFYPFGQSL